MILKDIAGYEGIYKISDDAKVINSKTGLEKKVWVNNKGYQCVDLSKDGVTKHYLLHRIYAEAFIPNPNNYPIILHLDNDKMNLSPENLVWGTYSENNAQAIQDGLNSVPRPDNRKVFSIYDDEIKEFCHGQDEVTRITGCNQQTIHNIVGRKSKMRTGPYKGCKIESINIKEIKRKLDVQRSSPGGGVEPQANGGRKIPI